MNLEHIRMLVLSVDLGSFSAASRKLGKSLSAVSMAISSLEDQFNLKIFDRSDKYPKLTPAGKRVYEHAALLLRQSERLQATAAGLAGEIEAELVIGLGELIPFNIIEGILEKLAKEFPSTSIRVHRDSLDNLRQLLNQDELNLVVCLSPGAVLESFDFYQIAVLDICCICSPDSSLADAEQVDNETLIATRQIVCSAMREHPVLKQSAQLSATAFETSYQEDMIKLVEQDIGWAFALKDLAQERIDMGLLKTFEPEFLKTEMNYPVDMWLPARASRGPVMMKLVDLLQSLQKQA